WAAAHGASMPAATAPPAFKNRRRENAMPPPFLSSSRTTPMIAYRVHSVKSARCRRLNRA
ncbi:MAG TPA: hypothetical protein PKZ25_04300, partial [Candidatus Hydrogenedentes bacterium]|nr:hypothetical protein [Candidatus Hydrogenedentota bacterium]